MTIKEDNKSTKAGDSESKRLLALDQEEKFKELQTEEVLAAEQALSRAHASARNSWERASAIVREYRPVASYLWRMVHSVLGKADKIGKPDPIMFDMLRPFLNVAAVDPTLSEKGEVPASIDEAVKRIGFDTAAAICVLHGVCRRVSFSLVQRIWGPIIDDALLRARVGYHIGERAKIIGKGRGMLAGFSGRAGLAVQIASSDMNKAQQALEGLAAGMDIRVMGLNIYGCDPLQVAAMILASAGVSKEAAIGVASFSENGKGISPKSTQFNWLSTFAITEFLRIGDHSQIDSRYWKALALDETDRREIQTHVTKIIRKGHGWGWVCESHLTNY